MKKIWLILFLIPVYFSVNAQGTQLGTEIWIEPGYSKEEIMGLAKAASASGFRDVRIFIMWTHLEPELNVWNFDVYDWIFEACEKYNLKLQVTLNPNQPAYHYGKEYWGSIHSHSIFSDPRMQDAAARYIRKVVERYKNSPALDNWWLMNEPYPEDKETPFVLAGFKTEMKNKYRDIEALNKMWNTSFLSFDDIKGMNDIINSEWAAAMPFYDWTRYCNKHLTEFQRWVRDEVLKSDKNHPFTTNPGAYLSLYYRQEASGWRPFLNSLGLSIHPTWHFDLFRTDQYAMGVAATCELGRSAANPNPFWISELSGGDNMYRYCPSSNDLAQWTWIGVAEGAQKIIYWLLNARPTGNESGEWALLNFQKEPGERLKTVTRIIGILRNEASFFDQAKPFNSNISILLSPESSLTNDRKKRGSIHTQAAIGCYQALYERGIAVKLEQTQDFQWAKSSHKAIILASMITIPGALIDSIKVFLKNGNKMIVLGPSGFYNEFEDCQFLNFPLKKEFGSEPKEIQTIEDRVPVSSEGGKYLFEASKIFGTIKNNSATPIFMNKTEVTGIRNKTANSEVVWIPSDIDVGAWKFDNNALSQFLADELSSYSDSQPFTFSSKTNLIGMQTMVGGGSCLTLITNGLNAANHVKLVNSTTKKATILFCSDDARKAINTEQEIVLSPRECLVLLWK